MDPTVEVVHSRSHAVLRRAVETFAARFQETLVLIPTGAATFAPTGNAVGSHRLTLLQFARQAAQARMAELGLAPVTRLGAEALAAHVVFQARSENTLRYFKPVAELPGFARALARTLRDLRLAGTTLNQLASGAPPAQDLAQLLRAYEDELEARALADHALILDLARQAVEQADHRWAKLPVAILDVPAETRAHGALIDALLKQAPQALLARSGEDKAEPNTSLDHLRRYLFDPAPPICAHNDGAFELFSAPGEGLEAVEIARRILRLSREGMKFDEMAILLRDPDRYQPVVDDALRRAQIPAYFSRGAVRPDPSGRAFLALLTCAIENLSASRFAEYLSLGQLPQTPVSPEWVEPSSDEQPYEGPEREETQPQHPTPRRWEQYLVDAAVIGGRDRWESRLRGLEAEWTLDSENNAERIAQLRNLRGFALPLIEALANLPHKDSWSTWLGALKELARQSLRSPEPIWAALAELEPMSDVGPVTLEEVTEVLSDNLRFLRREPPARRWGRVFVASIDEARGLNFRAVFLPGLAEGLFPRKLSEDPLLLDDYRREVDPELSLRTDLVDQERERLRLAAGAAREKLVASYPRMEVTEARPRVPSFYALELPRAIHGSVPELAEFERQARDAAPARLNWPAPSETTDAIDDAEYDLASIAHKSAQHILQASEPAARSLRARWRRWHNKWHPDDGLVVSQEAALEAMTSHQLTARKWSVSALETLAQCPYKFALRGIFGLRERDEAAALERLSPALRGELFHDIQKRLGEALREAHRLPVTNDNLGSALQHLEIVISKAAEEWAEKLVPAIPRVWDSEIDSLRTDLRGWLHHHASNEYDWEPIHFERKFETALDQITLQGKIDVIEQRGESLRVSDYKTGKAPETIPRWVGGGQHLQPLLYALAAEHELKAHIDCGRLVYATQRGGYTTVQIPLDDRARQFVAKLLADIDYMIASGFLPPVPAKDACEICDYRIVCGPYEERRLLKKDKRDERLDALVEIRGMA